MPLVADEELSYVDDAPEDTDDMLLNADELSMADDDSEESEKEQLYAFPNYVCRIMKGM